LDRTTSIDPKSGLIGDPPGVSTQKKNLLKYFNRRRRSQFFPCQKSINSGSAQDVDWTFFWCGKQSKKHFFLIFESENSFFFGGMSPLSLAIRVTRLGEISPFE
jgi:hypothetical protein